MKMAIKRRVLTILLASLYGLMCAACVNAAESLGGTDVDSYAEIAENGRNGHIKDDQADKAAAFKESGKTGETAVGVIRVEANPAPVTLVRRSQTNGQVSLERIIAEHICSTVVRERFGVLEFKHIIHSYHSLLLRICVLQI